MKRFNSPTTQLAVTVALTTALVGCCDRPKPHQAVDKAVAESAIDTPQSAKTAPKKLAQRFQGRLPCKTCDYINATLILKQDNTYEFLQEFVNYKTQDNNISVENGVYHGTTDSNTLTLRGNNRTLDLMIQNNTLKIPIFNDTSGQYTFHDLKNSDYFISADQQMFVNNGTMTHIYLGSGAYEKVIFEGLINLDEPAEDGHQSMMVVYDIDCKANRFAMPLIQHYKELNGRGKKMDRAFEKGQQMIFIAKDTNDMVTQAAARYCN